MVMAVRPVTKQIVAIDPGSSELTAVFDGDGALEQPPAQQPGAQAAAGHGGPQAPRRRSRVLSMSASTLHHRCAHVWRRRFQRRRLAGARRLQLWQGNIPTDRTASRAGMDARIRHVGPQLDEALEHYGARAQRRAGFHVRIMKAKLFSEIVKALVTSEDGRRLRKEEVVVGFGSASAGWGSPIPRQFGGMPNKGICRALCSHALVFMEAEPFTSKSCSLGHGAQQGLLEGRKETGGDEKWSYKVLVCTHCRTHWHRDVNAARNIRTLVCCRLLRLPRPAYLRRRQGPG